MKCILLALLLLAFWTSRSQNEIKSNVNYRNTIVVILQQDSGLYYSGLIAGAKKSSSSNSYHLDFFAPKHTLSRDERISEQISILLELTKHKPAAVILHPIDLNLLLPILSKLNLQKIPIVIIENGSDARGAQAIVGTDNFDIGQRCFKILINNSVKPLRIAYYANSKSPSDKERVHGFELQARNSHVKVTKISKLKLMKRFNALFISNSSGVITSLKTKIAAWCEDEKTCKMLSKLNAFILMPNSAAIGKASVETAVRIIKKQSYEPKKAVKPLIFINLSSIKRGK